MGLNRRPVTSSERGFDVKRTPPDLQDLVASAFWALLEEIPVGAEINEEQAADLLGTLEYFLPLRLELDFPEWRGESLDGFYFAKAEKTGNGTARFIGTCILISDQTMTPFFLELSLTASGDDLASIKLFLGEKGGGKLGISGPGWGTKGAWKLIENIPYRLDSIRWSYVLEDVSEGQ
jgi:hypothetical protein